MLDRSLRSRPQVFYSSCQNPDVESNTNRAVLPGARGSVVFGRMFPEARTLAAPASSVMLPFADL